jgi:hypothetical protein
MMQGPVTVIVEDPSYKEGTCDGANTDTLCPIHGSAPWPVAVPFCTGRRYWTCDRCNAFAQGSRCNNCGRGASLRIFDPEADVYADDALRRVRPQP